VARISFEAGKKILTEIFFQSGQVNFSRIIHRQGMIHKELLDSFPPNWRKLKPIRKWQK